MAKKVSESKHNFNTDFDQLLYDMEHGKVSQRLSPFYTRPAYYGTKQCINRPEQPKNCNDCAYYYKREDDSRKRCRFPWDNPKDSDMVIFKNLPCQK